MAHRYAENFENTDQSNPDVALDASGQAKSVVDSVINYARANPAEAIVVAAGAALALGLIVGYPSLQTGAHGSQVRTPCSSSLRRRPA
jgi:hypothetical protein